MKSGMVFPMVILSWLTEWLLYRLLANSCYRAAINLKNSTTSFFHKNPPSKYPNQSSLYPSLTKNGNFSQNNNSEKSFVCDIQGTLLRTKSLFPFFMLVAFEGGSIFRAFILLLSSPFLGLLDYEVKVRVMIFITFCGLRVKDMEMVGRAVLPKFYLENLNMHVYEVLASCGRKMVFTSVPRVMVEGFLREYLGVDEVKGTELQVIGKGNFFSGFVSADSGLLVKHSALKQVFGDEKPHIGVGTSRFHDHLFISLCQEAYMVNSREDNSKMNTSSTMSSSVMPRKKYPKPLVFHDGRLAFLPTPQATLAMFIWLPIGIFLAIFRICIGIFLPHKVALFLACLSGVKITLIGSDPPRFQNGKGVLYVCTHRTLLDPIFLSTVLNKSVTAVTYSLSRMSEVIAPIRTVRLTRDKTQDAQTMQRELSLGDLVVCPEGTTCREPYLLRFSALFAELADEIVPVAMDASVDMFYGTTAGGLKCLDPIFFFMNPRPSYKVHILGKVPKELTCAGGKSSFEVANHIQKQLAEALGFERTTFTRRDKYLMLAGNEGIVKNR
ncbi:unnamed protein product [Cuscuta epithymum]|uniref:Phospholipid/glycerol acyltransferase domain-containing protein n=1 Tax=Cuscuta epithymum TaxID=186058 RepID=A0AAV0GK61_9ASTE|nr:unnamed protein product [Cuscuta epithymum]